MRKFLGSIRMTAFVMALIAVLFAGCQGKPDTSADVTSSAPDINAINTEEINYGELEVGDTAPDFDVELLNGETVTLSDYQGKVVLLNFWATWCPPCIAEMPDIQKFSDSYAEEAVVLAVNSGEARDTASRYIEDNGYTFLVGLDENQNLMEKYPTDGIPYTVIIDGDGIITSIHLGGGTGMLSIFEEDLKNALGE